MDKNTERYTSYNEFKEADAMEELSPEDQELAAKIEKRSFKSRKSRVRRNRRTVILAILVFAALLTMCGREIVRLKAENLSLKRQHAQLEAERDRLTKELANVGNKEYVKDQARKQLRLLDPGEILFVFDEGQSAVGEVAEQEAKAAKKVGDKAVKKTKKRLKKEAKLQKAAQKKSKKVEKKLKKAAEEAAGKTLEAIQAEQAAETAPAQETPEAAGAGQAPAQETPGTTETTP